MSETELPDNIDQRLHKALSHPVRIEILRSVQRGLSSPAEVAAAAGRSVGVVSYHFRQLAELGLLELQSTSSQRGAIKHHYGLTGRSTTAVSQWREGGGNRTDDDVLPSGAAAIIRGLEQEAVLLERAILTLDSRGFNELEDEVRTFLARARRIEQGARRRQTGLTQTAVMLLYRPPEEHA